VGRRAVAAVADGGSWSQVMLDLFSGGAGGLPAGHMGAWVLLAATSAASSQYALAGAGDMGHRIVPLLTSIPGLVSLASTFLLLRLYGAHPVRQMNGSPEELSAWAQWSSFWPFLLLGCAAGVVVSMTMFCFPKSRYWRSILAHLLSIGMNSFSFFSVFQNYPSA